MTWKSLAIIALTVQSVFAKEPVSPTLVPLEDTVRSVPVTGKDKSESLAHRLLRKQTSPVQGNPTVEKEDNAKDAASPTNEAVSPAKDANPTNEAASPANDAASPTNEAVSPANEGIEAAGPAKDVASPATNDAVSPANDAASPTNEVASPAKDVESPAANDAASPAKDVASPAANDAASPAKDVASPAANDPVSPAKDVASPAANDAVSPLTFEEGQDTANPVYVPVSFIVKQPSDFRAEPPKAKEPESPARKSIDTSEKTTSPTSPIMERLHKMTTRVMISDESITVASDTAKAMEENPGRSMGFVHRSKIHNPNLKNYKSIVESEKEFRTYRVMRKITDTTVERDGKEVLIDRKVEEELVEFNPSGTPTATAAEVASLKKEVEAAANKANQKAVSNGHKPKKKNSLMSRLTGAHQFPDKPAEPAST